MLENDRMNKTAHPKEKGFQVLSLYSLLAVAERADDAVADLAHALALLLADVNGAVRCHSDGRWPEESGNRDTAIDAMLRLALLLRPARDGGDAVSLAVGAPDQAEAQIRDIKLPVRTLGHVRQIAERSRLAAPVGRAACAFSEMSKCILWESPQ